MQVNNTNVIVEKTMDPFKDFGANIIGNIVDYNSSFDEEKGQKTKEDDASFEKKIESSIEATTSNAPLPTVVETPSTPPTQATMIAI